MILFPYAYFSMPIEIYQCEHTMLKKKNYIPVIISFFKLKKKREKKRKKSSFLYSYSHVLSIMIRSIFFTTHNLQNQCTKTFDFIENCPNITYTRATYPLHIINNKSSLNLMAININFKIFNSKLFLWLFWCYCMHNYIH